MHRFFLSIFRVSGLVLVVSFPLAAGPVPVCKGIANDFASPSGDFGNCWSSIGDVVAGAAGVGPTISQATGTDPGSLQGFVANGGSFLFSNYTADSLGFGSAIQTSLILSSSDTFNVSFTSANTAGSLGFLVIQNGSGYSFLSLFDNPSSIGIVSTPSLLLGAGSYTVSIGIVGATTPLIFATDFSPALTGPQITGITIQDIGTPEPATLWLLAGGLAGLAALRRRLSR